MDIRCRKTSCKYNDKQTCQAKEILIGKKVDCATFVKGNKNQPDLSKSIFQETPEFARQRDVKTMKIGCKADCIFNEEGKCTANGITVNSLIEPYCMTFLKK